MRPVEPNELIVCRDVSLGYEGQSVLTHLDLTVRKGDYLCIVGDNGSGKSTLLRGLLGLLTPQSGQILRAPELRQGAVGGLGLQGSDSVSGSAQSSPNNILSTHCFFHVFSFSYRSFLECTRN